MLISVVYHYVRPEFVDPYPGIHGVTPAELEAQLGLLATIGEFVSGAEIRDASRDRATLPPAALLVTFDDGLREQAEVALPVLDRLGIPAVFFVNTAPLADASVLTVHKIHLLRARLGAEAFVTLIETQARQHGLNLPALEMLHAALAVYRYDSPETAQLKYLLNFHLQPSQRDLLIADCFESVFGEAERTLSGELYMSSSQIRMLADRGYLGTHGHTHVPLGLLPVAAIEEDLARSLELLSRWGGVRPYALGYPYGSREACSIEAARVAAALGIEFAFTAERAGNSELTFPFHLARFDCNDLPGGRCPLFELQTLFKAVPPARWHR